jgi:hypothetical protein
VCEEIEVESDHQFLISSSEPRAGKRLAAAPDTSSSDKTSPSLRKARRLAHGLDGRAIRDKRTPLDGHTHHGRGEPHAKNRTVAAAPAACHRFAENGANDAAIASDA